MRKTKRGCIYLGINEYSVFLYPYIAVNLFFIREAQIVIAGTTY